jgi:2'-5' RNA ligase
MRNEPQCSQLAFDFAPGDPKARDRLFFAAFLEAEAARRAEINAHRLCRAYDLRGRVLQPGRMHVTLAMLGNFRREAPSGLIDMAKRVASRARFGAFDVLFDRATTFMSDKPTRPVVMLGGKGVSSFVALHCSLGVLFGEAGLTRGPAADFTPHVTLLYDRLIVPSQSIEPVSWRVTDFTLVRSLLGRTIHVPLERWALSGA